MNKKIIRNIITSVAMASILLGGAVQASGVWTQINGKWFLSNTDGTYSKGWQKSGNYWYYMATDGTMQVGWKLIGGKWYYLNPNGDMKTGWLLDNGKWYYLNPSGDMAIGWKQVGPKWYYLNSNGDMAFSTTIQGYTLGSDGAWITSTSSNTGSNTGTNTGGTTGGSNMWNPLSGTVATIGGLSSNMTKSQFDAIAIEAPESMISSGSLQAHLIPHDGKLYHHLRIDDYGGGLVNKIDVYYKYLYTVNVNGQTVEHYLKIWISQGVVTFFADSLF